VIDGIDQHRNPQDIGQENELLSALRTHFAGTRKEVDRLPPFVMSDLSLPHDRMHVADNQRQDLA
jgi:hypothetical protein